MTFFLILFLASTPTSLDGSDTFPSATLLEFGYRQMYDLRFGEAHNAFQAWEESHPDDPMGPASEAAAYLFSEFNRLGILQSEFFASDERIRKGSSVRPDPAAKEGFDNCLARSEKLADAILSRSPQDGNALFAKVLNMGLRADYVGLIEKRLFASLGYMKNGRMLAEKLLTIDPTNYDAYLASGVEDYVLGSSPAPVRWFLTVLGARTDKTRGLESVRITAEKGHYLLPYARLLLAIAALRDKDPEKARELLEWLAGEFPNNNLYKEELSRLEAR